MKPRTTEILQRMATRGLRVDVSVLDKMIAELECVDAQRAKVAAKIGVDPWKRDGLAKVLGTVGTTRAVLLKKGTKNALLVAKFRELHRRYQDLRTFRNLVDKTGKLSWTWSSAKTGRLYCSGKLLSMPKAARRSVIPWVDGHHFTLFDYNSQELRIIAAVTGTQLLLDMINRGEDIHALTAGNINLDRREGKTANYAILYGMEREAFKRQFGITDIQVDRIMTYLPMENLKEVARSRAKDGKVQTIFGTWIPYDVDNDKTLVSYFIQGSGAEDRKSVV